MRSPFHSYAVRMLSVVCLSAPLLAVADVKLPRLVSDGMVLQRDKPLTLWGWADNGEVVTVSLAGQTLKTTAENGRWSVTAAPIAQVGPVKLMVQGNNTIQINNAVVGDVWIAAGQSNMQMPIEEITLKYPNLVSSTSLPDIREFYAPFAYSFTPKDDFSDGKWKTATPEFIKSFSATGFFFARKMYQQDKVPVGLITIPIGGSPAEAWISNEGLKKYPHYEKLAERYKDSRIVDAANAKDKADTDGWFEKTNKDDVGNKQQPWVAEQFDTATWEKFTLPGSFKEQGIDFQNGVAYLRRTFEVTAAQASEPAVLWLGNVLDSDETYINGQLVGKISHQYAGRMYPVNAKVLHEGVNTLAVRLTSYTKNPSFVKDKKYYLAFANTKIDLRGQWQYKIATRQGDFPQVSNFHYQPAGLFNAKLYPTLHTAVKGIIWYQGESNAEKAQEYFTLFPDLIRDWRAQFNQGDLPFIFVQLANYMEAKTEPQESGWALLREAQRKTLELPNTGMAVALDVGEWNDIHPVTKQPVGERLAAAAIQVLNKGSHSLPAGSPLPQSIKKQGAQLIVSFKGIGKGLVAKNAGDGKVHHVAIAGADKKFVWADAALKANQLIVSSTKIADPVFVRYAWADNPEGANLYNADGFPASSFEMGVTP